MSRVFWQQIEETVCKQPETGKSGSSCLYGDEQVIKYMELLGNCLTIQTSMY
jgi:hypothetical protein